MKDILENSETFEAYARIDYCYYAIKKLHQQSLKPVSPIHHAIDVACKYDPEKERVDATIELLKEIIESKKLIEADYSGDEQILNEVTKLQKIK